MTQIVFGNGNVLIGGGRGRLAPHGNPLDVMAYFATLTVVDKKHEIGKTISRRDAMSLKQGQPTVELVFLNPESISALRLQLETLEDYFIQARNNEQPREQHQRISTTGRPETQV